MKDVVIAISKPCSLLPGRASNILFWRAQLIFLLEASVTVIKDQGSASPLVVSLPIQPFTSSPLG